MRLRTARFLLAPVVATMAGAVLALVAPAGTAYATDAGGLGVIVHSGNPLAPTVVLTNHGTAPCQVVASATGTLALRTASQGGTDLTAVGIIPSYADDLGLWLSQHLRTLAPGASITLAIPVVPEGTTGHALQTVSWSPLATFGTLRPVVPGKPLALRVTYSSPVPVTSGAPLCPSAEGVSVASAVTGTPHQNLLWILGAAVLVIVLIGLLVLVLLRRRRRTSTTAAATALVLVISFLAVGWRPAPASATISPDSDVASAANACLAGFRKPGGDPGRIMSTLDMPANHVQILYDNADDEYGGDGENRYDPHNIFVHWDPNDHGHFADGLAHDPCDELYHELFHAFEDTTPQGVDLHECITAAGGHSGISIKEVNATRAENALRHNLGQGERTLYGRNKLPPGLCLPVTPTTPLCHPTRGCPPPPAPPPASSSSDPHMRTFDGRRYDFQGAGEFTAVNDPSATGASTFQIQTRQQPWPGNRFVTLNTAIAADVAGDRVEVRTDSGHMVLFVNGAPQPLASASLPKGGDLIYTTAPNNGLITVDWPDSSYALITMYGTTALTLNVWAAPARAGKLVGLFGNDDGDAGNDVRIGTGAPITDTSPYDALYPAYANSMRITDATSLFTYLPGTNTETYTDRTFPDRMPPPGSGNAWAVTLCGRFGITDPVSLADCVEDVVNTGGAEFVGASQGEQAPAATGAGIGGASVATITTPGATSTVTYAGTAGQNLYIQVVSSTLPSACGVLTLKGPDGKVLGSGCVVNGVGGIDDLVLPSTGTYTVVIDPPGAATGQVSLRFISATDQQSTLTIDGPEATVAVTAAGGIGRLSFQGTGGEIVYLTVTSSTLANECGVLTIHGAGDSVLSSGCVINGGGSIDRTVLPSTGTYSVVVDPAQTGIGSVHMRLTSATDEIGTIAVNGAPVTIAVSQPGAIAAFSFTATAGQHVTVSATNSTFRSACGLLQLRDATGGALTSGCVLQGTGAINGFALPTAGTYSVVVDPEAGDTGQMTLTVHS